MKEALFVLIILFLSLVSCQSKTTEEKTVKKETEVAPTLEDYEVELISQLINELIDPIPPYPPVLVQNITETDAAYNERYEKREKDYQNYIDTTTFTVYLDDTLDVLSEYRNSRRIVKHDTAYYGLAKKLISDTLTPRCIDLKMIDNFKYKLIENYPNKWPEWRSDYLGSGQFSRIVFNKKYTRALFYFEFQCGGLCGSGHLLLAEKKSGKWQIVRDEVLWVA
jgi:hypothetical protein